MASPAGTLDRSNRGAAWPPAAERERTNMTAIDHVVRGVLAYHTNRDASAILPRTDLYADLGLTTLGLALVILDVEDVHGVRLASDALASLVTVGDLVAAVCGRMAAECATVPRRTPPERSLAPEETGAWDGRAELPQRQEALISEERSGA
jgi:acyl carrier protein